MSSAVSPSLLAPSALALAVVAVFLVYATVRYVPIIGRIFEEKPLFLPLRLAPREGGEEVRFRASDGLELAGTYLHATTGERVGVLVFCHEYLSDRWSYQAYAEGLRDLGYDVFTFDFRNHGASAGEPTYQPMQWVTDHEANDLRGALAYLRSRPDHDRAGFGLFGISRGGGTALVVAAEARDVWGVITDGAFPTRGTMFAYILRWAEIYIRSRVARKCMPFWVFHYLSWTARLRSARRLHCRFPDVETAVARLSPRPWLLIHGEKDAYIGPDIARRLFDEAHDPKEIWIVPRAKHNRCRELAQEAYAGRVADFFARYAPRRPLPRPEPEPADSSWGATAASPRETPSGIEFAAPVPG